LTTSVTLPFSISCLFKGPASPADDYLWELDDDGSNACVAFLDQAGRWVRMTNLDTGGATITNDTGGYTAGAWTLCVVTVSSGGVCKLYRNTNATTAGTNRSPNGMTELVLGRSDSGQYLDGEMAEFAIWKGTELSAANVASLYNSGTFKRPNDIGVAPTWYWPLVNALTDSGSNGDTLTNLNSATFSTHPTLYEPPPATAGLLLRRVA
jgi:hypothetical protein